MLLYVCQICEEVSLPYEQLPNHHAELWRGSDKNLCLILFILFLFHLKYAQLWECLNICQSLPDHSWSEGQGSFMIRKYICIKKTRTSHAHIYKGSILLYQLLCSLSVPRIFLLLMKWWIPHNSRLMLKLWVGLIWIGKWKDISTKRLGCLTIPLIQWNGIRTCVT